MYLYGLTKPSSSSYNEGYEPTPLAAKADQVAPGAVVAYSWLEALSTGALLFIVYLLLGGYLAFVRHYLPGDALARMVSAYLVFNGTEAKLSTIGFVWPPIPTLLMLPLAMIQELVKSWLVVVIVSAAFMAAACVTVGFIAGICGIGPWWRRLLILLFATNPLVVVFGSNGMSEGILFALTLAAFYWLLRFWQSDYDGHLIIASAILGLLPLVRYEMALLTVGAGLLMVVPTSIQSWRKTDGHSYKIQARLIAFATLAGYPIVLWALASWQIMGSPTYFLANDRSALNVSQVDLGGSRLDGAYALLLAGQLWVLAFPAGLLAMAATLFMGLRHTSGRLLALAILPLAIPLFQGLMLGRGSIVPLLRYYIIAIPLGYILALATIRYFQLSRRTKENKNPKVPSYLLVTMALFFLVSNAGAATILSEGKHQDIEYQTWVSLTTQEKLKDHRVSEAMGIGRKLTEIVPSGSRILLDEYMQGFAVLLGSDDPKMFMDHTDSNYEQALRNPRRYVDYLLVPDPAVERGSLYAINRWHPTLYAEEVPWAQHIDKLPPTQDRWRLFKVQRQ